MKNRGRAFAICFFLLVWCPVPAWAEMAVQTCFSPQGRCSAHIIREIDKAQKELLIAVYAFTNDEIARGVAQAKKRGVSVQIVLDREFDAANEKSQGRFLEGQNIPVKRLSGMKPAAPEKEPGLMHQKFAVIDRKIVFTGSYNWTRSADNSNDENLLWFREAGPLAEEYRKVFFQLWERKG
jgi:phosphatidylserine/phosphatidylglycerophosphate/cardiolipin synthase-like enzyme